MTSHGGKAKTKLQARVDDHHLDPQLVQELNNRLLSLEGHIRGIQRMLEDQATCEELLTQTSAARAALGQINIKIVEGHFSACMLELAKGGEIRPTMDRVRGALAQVMKNG